MNNVLTCLEKYKAAYSGQGYPADLAEAAGAPGCGPLDANPSQIAGYGFSYVPGPVLANGRAASFRYEARLESGWSGSPYVTDPSGIICGQTQGGVYPMGGSYGAYLLSYIRRCTREVANLYPNQDIGSLLQEGRTSCYAGGQSWGSGWQIQNGMVLYRITSSTGYTVEMQVAQSAEVAGLTITGSARCTNYGTNCLRSYFMDEAGVIHGTPEPRSATRSDPSVPACESSSTPCDSTLPK